MSTFDIGLFNNSYTVQDTVSLASPDDLYNFTLASPGGLQASFTGMSSPLNWQLKDSGGSTLQSGLIDATNPEAINLYNLAAGNYSLQVSQAAGDTAYGLKLDPLTNFNFDSGFFTVEQRGQVSFDFVIDGGWYEGELAIFSMKEIDKFNPGSEAFIKETTRRALTNSTEGYVVISDRTEGAKLTSNFAFDGNFNAGEYKGIKTFAMTPGDKFGVLMVPNGTVQEVFNNPSIGGDKRPLFSLATANPNDAFHVGQIADVTKDSKTFAMEDIRYDLGSDKDYNDFIFRVSGARGVAIGLDEVIDPKKDWRNTTVGEDLRKYINTPPQLLQFNLNPIYQFGETINITNAKVFDENRDVTKVIFTLKKPDGSKVSNEINNFTFNEDWASFNYGLSNLAAGNYELEAIAHDKLEQTSTSFGLKFTVNAPVVVPPNTAPQSLQFTILPSYSLGETVNLMGGKVYDVNGSSDLNKVDFQLQKDGGGWQDISDVTTFNNDSGDSGWGNFNYSLMGLDAGKYELKAIAYDKSGAFSNEVVQNFIVNPPVVLPSNTAPGALQFSVLPLYTNEEKISFNGAKVFDSDGVGDIHKVDFWLRHPDGTWFDIDDVTQFTADSKGRGRFNYSYDLSGLAPGRYQLWGIANDKSFNYSQPFFQNFSVITDSGTGGLSDDVRLAAAEAANLNSYEPQALAQTREWVVWVTPGRSSSELASQIGAQDIGATGQIPNTYIWKFPDTIAPRDVANQLGRLNGVEFAYPQVPVDIHLLYQPPDRLFSEQWNLRQANVPAAWDIISPVTSQPVRGRNAVIAIVDDGIAYQHSELQGRFNPALSWDFSDNDSDPAPTSNVTFNGDFSSPNINLMDMTLAMPVNLTGMVTDVNVKFNVKNSLPADLPRPTDLDVYLYSPDQSADDPGTWFNPNRPGRWPGSEDLKFAQKVQLFIREDGSVEFDRNKLKGSYAGGIWKLEIQNPDPNIYNREQLERIVKELFNSWSLQVQTLNPHGTAVAGIAGATENNTGIVGVAPQAQLAGLRLIGNIDQFSGVYKSTGYLIADALFQTIPRPNQSNRNQFIDIFNNSWGPEYVNRQPLALAALANGVNFGRNGRGNNYVFAAGNDGYWGGNVNYNSFANSRHAIAVAAIGNNNIRAPYSTQGASVLVSAYSDNGQPKNNGFVGITTTSITRNNGYAGDFGGTSAAAPFVSGEIALMLEANPNLTSRDVQNILVKTAQPIDVVRDSLGNIQAGNGWTKNQAGYWFNNKYGFGAIDVPKAVTTAANWTTVEAESRFESAQELVGDEIPNGVGELEPSIIKVDQDITIEKVEVLLDVQHQNWADLKVVLTSPDGTQSVLAEPILDNARFKPKLNWWTLTSVHHWGESSKGDWKLQVFDRKGNEFTGNWESWKLNLYGTKPTVTISATDANATEDGDFGQFIVTRSGSTEKQLTVNYSLAGNATNGIDYSTLSSSITIPAGAAMATIPIIPLADAEVEGNETVQISLTGSYDYNVGSNSSGIVTIQNRIGTSQYGPFIYVNPANNNLYLLSQTDTWLGAQQQAKSIGGNLVTINDATENNWLVNTFGNSLFWIGLTDSPIYGATEGNFKWVSGEPVTYTNWHDAPQQPDNYNFLPEGENFSLMMGVHVPGRWYDSVSDMTKIGPPVFPYPNNQGIIEIDPTTITKPIVMIRATDANAGEDGNAGQLIVTRFGDTTKPLTVNYSVLGNAVNGIDYRNLTGNITIDAGKSLATIPIIPIADNEVEGNETVAVQLLKNNNYNVAATGNSVVTIANSTPPANPVIYTNPVTGNKYLLTTPDTWLGAQEQAAAAGGNLVTINNVAERDWLFQNFGSSSYWIGLNDSPIYGNQEGNFEWVSKEPVTYTNWWPDQPDSVLHTPEGEDFVEMNDGQNRRWNDLPHDLSVLGPTWQQNTLRGIIEIPFQNSRWNAKFINRTALNVSDRNTYDFSNPAAVLDLGAQNQGRSDGGLRLYRDWNANPVSGVQDDNFAMEAWTRTQFEAGKLYKITTRSDDGTWFRLKNAQTGEWIGDSVVLGGDGADWRDRGITRPPRTIFFKVPESAQYDFYVQYYEKSANALIDINVEEAQVFQDPVNESQQWNSTVFWWDRKQGNVPPGDFYNNQNNIIGVISQGSNTRSDGKKGINFNFPELEALSNDTRLPDNNYAIRSYTQTYLESGVKYRARVRGDDGFQLLAKRANTDQWVYITPKDQWQQAYGVARQIDFTVSQDGMYDMHFHHYEERGNAFLDFSWEVVPFSGTVLATAGANIRSAPNTSQAPVGFLNYRTPVTFDKWTRGQFVDYRAELGTSSDIWYRIAGTNNWISAAIIDGNP